MFNGRIGGRYGAPWQNLKKGIFYIYREFLGKEDFNPDTNLG